MTSLHSHPLRLSRRAVLSPVRNMPLVIITLVLFGFSTGCDVMDENTETLKKQNAELIKRLQELEPATLPDGRLLHDNPQAAPDDLASYEESTWQKVAWRQEREISDLRNHVARLQSALTAKEDLLVSRLRHERELAQLAQKHHLKIQNLETNNQRLYRALLVMEEQLDRSMQGQSQQARTKTQTHTQTQNTLNADQPLASRQPNASQGAQQVEWADGPGQTHQPGHRPQQPNTRVDPRQNQSLESERLRQRGEQHMNPNATRLEGQSRQTRPVRSGDDPGLESVHQVVPMDQKATIPVDPDLDLTMGLRQDGSDQDGPDGNWGYMGIRLKY